MIRILEELGARDEDFYTLKTVGEHLAPDPTLPFRETNGGRFCLDSERNKISRLEFQPFVLSIAEDFVRHDSGKLRSFRGIGDNLQLNKAFHALLFFKYFIIRDVNVSPRANLDMSSAKWVSTVFPTRTITTPDLLGEPALEGVHSDGVDHTMTSLLGSHNMMNDSAKTFIHDMREENSKRWNETNRLLRTGEFQHKKFLDTVLIIDHERKHSLSPVHATDPNQRATRDVIIFFTRKPATEGHISYHYDSFNPHLEFPLSLDIPQPPVIVRADDSRNG
ncbi:2OG-Fe dioxygenase family protein [Gluconacetobacter sacchari]|uniref:2OG-Fe dioxygenase family protein n=2 Tax=Gluconacetobacter sacchari TaxID=92759 RepID=A0A7W4NQ80_9PROT|nr:2OG-Fe dioxygenase family protein [Gluconacetobacter sacchari]